MRGTFAADFDLDTVYKVGLALPEVVKGNRWLVGRDCRTTSDAVHDALCGDLGSAARPCVDGNAVAGVKAGGISAVGYPCQGTH